MEEATTFQMVRVTGRKVTVKVETTKTGYRVSSRRGAALYTYGEFHIWSRRDAAETAVGAGDV